ncbi:hypothetical protein OFN94_30100, partial [Escherichia coli]|nr:hypothetical protein [Escherichia coli]
MDGYDEVADLVERDEHHPLSRWLEGLFSHQRVILTTRPRHVKGFVEDRKVEMTGFAIEDVLGKMQG